MSLPMGRGCGNPGDRCGILPIGPSGYCQRHDPEQAAIRARQSSQAAKKSHEWKPDAEVTAWADTLDFSTPESRSRALTETAQLVAKGGLSVGQGNAIAALARAAEGRPGAPPKKPATVLVEVAKYGTNGYEEPSS
jgi:hypothetical protein